MNRMTLKPERNGAGLAEAIEKILDKGLVINADITVSVVGVELLGLRIRAALASFETAAKYGLEFPAGTNKKTPVWRKARIEEKACPRCGEQAKLGELLSVGCPWCGWKSAKSRELEKMKTRPESSELMKLWK